MLATLRRTLAASAALTGILVSGVTLATATVSLTPSGPLSYNTSQSNQTLSVDFSVSLGGSGTVDDVMVQFDHFVAYNPEVLKYKSSSPITFGSALSSTSGSPPRPSTNVFNDLDYTAIGAGALDASITGVGTPVSKTGYYDGSLHVGMVINNQAGFKIDDLLATQNAGSALLFTIVFDVVTTQIGSSAIVLLDDTSFLTDITPPTYDAKYWDEGNPTPFYPTSNVLQVVVTDAPVPVPAPLALIATGLVGMAARRRRAR